MTVKTIFKVLLGTAIILVVLTMVTELFNVMIVSLRLSSLSKIAANQAAELFAQESYKNETGQRTTNLANIRYPAGVDENGNSYSSGEYLSGIVYGNGSNTEIWTALYSTNAYKAFSNKFQSNWSELKIMNKALTDKGKSSAYLPSVGSATASQLQAYNEAMLANTYYNNLYTPLNIGIPYIGEYGKSKEYSSNKNSALDKIFRWNLTQLLSNCDPANICKDASGEFYVMYSGFRCYTKKAEISDVEYTVYDVSKSADKSKFKTLTGIDPSNLSLGSASYLTTTTQDQRQNICVATITYKMDVSYTGVTPIKSVFEWVWKNEVQGLESSAPNLADKQWQNTTQTLTGTTIYYIVR